MKKKKKIVLAVLALLLIGLVLLGYIQRNNIQAVIYMFTMDEEQLSQAITTNEKDILAALGQKDPFNIELTEEQKIGIANGLIDPEEIAEQIMAKRNAAVTPKEKQTASSNADIDQLIGVKVSKLYVLKASYIGQLEGLVQQAQSEYLALPQDQRTNSNKQKIAKSKISAAGNLEGACDAQVSAIVEEIRSLLRQAGRDTSLANQIMSSYSQEKSLKKAYYFDQIE